MSAAQSRSKRIRAGAGFSMIELMVVLVISILMSLAVFGVLTSAEGRKRTTTSVDDVIQGGTFAMYILDKQIRSAGSGFAQTWQQTFGCELNVSDGGATILPTSYLPPEFSTLVPGTANAFRMAPVLIAKNQSTPGVSGMPSDFLIIMSGNAGYGEMPTKFGFVPTATNLNLLNTVAFSANDLVLAIDALPASGPSPCLVEQVASTFAASGTATALPISGTYLTTVGANKSLTSFSATGSALDLGQAPNFAVWGVGGNNTLFTYDLLQLQASAVNAAPSTAVVDGVFEIHALYGVDTVGDGSAFNWVDPGVAPYDIATLMNGSQQSSTYLWQIRAIRLAIIMRTSLPERVNNSASSTSVTLFKDVQGGALTYTRTFTGTEKTYRYRVFESTIPIRNSILANKATPS